MAEFIGVFFMGLAGALALGCAINYFLQTGLSKALGYGLFTVAIFLLFCMSGLWDGASRHAWGPLAPVFALMLIGGWFSLKYGRKLWSIFKKSGIARTVSAARNKTP